MKCYDCGARVSHAIRQWREAKDARYKPAFRDVCEPCYDKTVEIVTIDGCIFKRPARRLAPCSDPIA